jgi:Ca-activated chloride channel family protein
VAFSDSGVSVQTPTADQATVLAAIDRLTPQRGTSLGQGILDSLKVIAVAEAGPWVDYYTNASPAPSTAPTPTPVPSGYHAPAAIVLLTDGENNENPDPIAVAQAAANAGVRIYTVGVGTTAGTTVNLNGFQVHTQMNQPALQQIADLTGGNFYGAANADQLKSVYDNLDTRLVTPAELTELTGIFAGASVLLLLAGVATSLAWLGRMP